MKILKKGILFTLATLILGGAIIGVSSQTANSSKQLMNIRRAESSSSATSATSEVVSSSEGSTTSTTESLNYVKVGDELKGKTIWFNPYILFGKVDFSNLSTDDHQLINFGITGYATNTSDFSTGSRSFSHHYRGHHVFDIAYFSYTLNETNSKHSLGKLDDRLLKFNTSNPANDYSFDLDESIYNDWFSITFYDETTFKNSYNVELNSFSIKVSSFSDELNNVFLYEKPKVISYKNNIKTIYKQKNAILTIDDIIERLDIKGYKTLKLIKDEYSGKGNKPGDYDIVLEYTDVFETGTIAVNVIVSKDDLPTAVWNFEYIDLEETEVYNLVIDTNERLKFTKDDLISIVSYCSDLNNEIVSFEVTGAPNVTELLEGDGIEKEGSYSVSVSVKSSTGVKTGRFETKINVASKDSGTVIDKRLTVWQKFCKFFSNIGKNIKNFFVWLYDHTIGAIVKFFQRKD